MKKEILERKQSPVETIRERLQHDNSTVSDSLLLSRATFLSNLFPGSRHLSSFELARGYKPALLGIGSRVVTTELHSAYKQQSMTRAISEILGSRSPSTTARSCLSPNTEIYYFYKSSKQNEADKWKAGTVISAEPYYVTISTSTGRKTNMAYEDLQLRPNSALAEKLSSGYMEGYITPKISSHLRTSSTDTALLKPARDCAENAPP